MGISKTVAKKLRDLYVGEVVIIHLKGLNVVVSNEESGEIAIAPMIEDVVLDVDESFYYLGNPSIGVSRTVSHDTVGMIEIVSAVQDFLESQVLSDEEVH